MHCRCLYPIFAVFFLLLSIFSLPVAGQSTQFQWAKTYGGGNNYAPVTALRLAANKEIIASGSFKGTVDFDPGPGVSNLVSKGGSDIYIARYDTAGTFVSVLQIGGIVDEAISDLKLDNEGNIILVGIIQTTVDVDPGPGVVNLTPYPGTGANTIVLKLDKNGNFIWVKQLAVAFNRTLDIDNENNIIFSGEFANTYDFDPGSGVFMATATSTIYFDIFIEKLDSAGNFVWMRQLANSSASQHQQWGLESDAANNIYLAGNFTQTLDFDPSPTQYTMTAAGNDDAFVLKLNKGGGFEWAKRWGNTGVDKVFQLEVDKQGNVYTTGEYAQQVDFDPGPGTTTLTTPTNRCCYISKLDATGNFVFARTLEGVGESFGQCIRVDSSSNIYVSGGCRPNVDFDPGPAVQLSSYGWLFTLKLNSSGNLNWAVVYNELSNSGYESVWSEIMLDGFNNVYYSSVFTGIIDFDPGPATYIVNAPFATNSSTTFIHKLSQCHTNTNVSASYCNSYTYNGTTYTGSGIFFQYFPRANNCDSILVLNLTRLSKSSSTSMVACGSYTRNGRTYTSSGTYTDTFRLANGCDSIAQLRLTINPRPQPNLGKDTLVCNAAALTLRPGNFTTYLWSNGTTADSLRVSASGPYAVQVTAANGCPASDTIGVQFGGPGCNSNPNPCASAIRFYPAPFSNWLIAQKPATNCEVRMSLYNVLGQLVANDMVIKDGTNRLYLPPLAAGFYFYRLSSGGAIFQKGQLLKQ